MTPTVALSVPLLALLLLPSAVCGQRAADRFVPLVPPWFETCVLYHNAFETGPDEPDVNAAEIETDLQSTQPPQTHERGLAGRCLDIRDPSAPLVLRSPALSPHRPLTISFWWALPYDLTLEGGYSLFSIRGKGMIALFSRGKGEWCALQRPAGVFQVYYFQGIQNVNDIYDGDLLSHYDLRAGVWHHAAIVCRRAATAQVYVDGRLVTQVTISGREWTAEDVLNDLTLGGPLLLDELLILDRAVDGGMIEDYYAGLSRLHEYLSPVTD